MGGGTKTVHHTTKTPNDYDDAWIRSKFDDLDRRGQEFSNWRSGREAQLGYEATQRQSTADALAGLTGDFRALGSTVEGLGSRQQQLGADFRGLGATQTQQFKDLSAAQRQAAMEQNEQFQNMTAQQQQQFKDIYNLQGQGGVEGVRTQKGLTQNQRRGGGAYGGFNRGGMRINQSLNI
tara:strand:- start:3086 stop:3622 length:537 start_codon:yes stop_codon:yes gene_type:complete